MPTYVYECQECGHSEELVQKISERSTPDCPEHQTPMLSIIQRAGGFKLLGLRWSRDGYEGDPAKAEKSVLADRTGGRTSR